MEIFTTNLNNGKIKPERSEVYNAHALLQAPYGIYESSDGHVAIAMGKLQELFELFKINDTSLLDEAFDNRNEIKDILAKKIKHQTSKSLLELFETKEIWCTKVSNYHQFLNSDEFKTLGMKQEVKLQNGTPLSTTRCPIRINGLLLTSETPAPRVGEHTEYINKEFNL